jgi:G:T/U-mismatch repair DNA glycosylase
VFCNGGASHALCKRFFPDIPAVRLPSTSPAAAMFSYAHKLDAWRAVKDAAEEAS